MNVTCPTSLSNQMILKPVVMSVWMHQRITKIYERFGWASITPLSDWLLDENKRSALYNFKETVFIKKAIVIFSIWRQLSLDCSFSYSSPHSANPTPTLSRSTWSIRFKSSKSTREVLVSFHFVSHLSSMLYGIWIRNLREPVTETRISWSFPWICLRASMTAGTILLNCGNFVFPLN